MRSAQEDLVACREQWEEAGQIKAAKKGMSKPLVN